MRGRWALIMFAVMFVGLAAGGLAYVAHVQQTADHRWCSLLNTLASPDPPPTTDRGRQVLRQTDQLRRDLGCVRT